MTPDVLDAGVGVDRGRLAALTGREEARYLDASDVERLSTVEPQSAYFVTRARREQLRYAEVGGWAVSKRRSLSLCILDR